MVVLMTKHASRECQRLDESNYCTRLLHRLRDALQEVIIGNTFVVFTAHIILMLFSFQSHKGVPSELSLDSRINAKLQVWKVRLVSKPRS